MIKMRVITQSELPIKITRKINGIRKQIGIKVTDSHKQKLIENLKKARLAKQTPQYKAKLEKQKKITQNKRKFIKSFNRKISDSHKQKLLENLKKARAKKSESKKDKKVFKLIKYAINKSFKQFEEKDIIQNRNDYLIYLNNIKPHIIELLKDIAKEMKIMHITLSINCRYKRTETKNEKLITHYTNAYHISHPFNIHKLSDYEIIDDRLDFIIQKIQNYISQGSGWIFFLIFISKSLSHILQCFAFL